jgi:hypothetical protein
MEIDDFQQFHCGLCVASFDGFLDHVYRCVDQGPQAFLYLSPQGLPPLVQLRERDGALMAPVPDRFAADAYGLSDFTIRHAEDQEIDGLLLLGGQRFICWWLCDFASAMGKDPLSKFPGTTMAIVP